MGAISKPPEAEFEITKEDETVLLAQFSDDLAKSQDSYDLCVRAIAAGGVATVASLATALHALDAKGVACFAAFVVALGLNLLSYATEQADVITRSRRLRDRRLKGLEGNRWTKATWVLNAVAGVSVIVGAVLLAVFITGSI